MAVREHDKPRRPDAETGAHDGSETHTDDRLRFSGAGPLPGVAHGTNTAGMSPSDRAFGPGGVAGSVPKQVDLSGANASVTIPANRKLAGNWMYDAQTRGATTVNVSITQHGFQISMSPGIYLDVTWPGRDCQIDGVSMNFGGAPRARVSDGGGYGAIPVSGMVEDKVEGMLSKALAGTRLTDKNYDPLHDGNLAGTLQQVASGFARLFEGGGPKPAGNSGVGLQDVTARSLGASFSLKEPIHIGKNIEISGGSSVHLEAMGAANLATLTNADDNTERANAIRFQSLRLSSSGLDVAVDGKPVARMEELTFHHGGQVTVERFTPLGKLAKARNTEAGLSGLAALLALAAGDGNAAGQLANNANNPGVVQGVAGRVIEDKLEGALQKLILQHRGAIPGVDLANALGIR